MQEIKLLVDESLIKDVELVLEENGLNMQNIFTVMLKRIDREQGIGFLFGRPTDNKFVEKEYEKASRKVNINTDNKMTKNVAKRLFDLHSDNVTFASKNKGANNYWANPSFDCLNRDWYLMLNDWQRKELHLFKIPAKSLYNLVARADQPGLIDLQIAYNDPTFTDNRSNGSFKKYLMNTVKY